MSSLLAYHKVASTYDITVGMTVVAEEPCITIHARANICTLCLNLTCLGDPVTCFANTIVMHQ